MGYAPMKPYVAPPTYEEAQRIVDELDKKFIDGSLKKHQGIEKAHKQKLPFLVKPLNRKVIAYGLRGSVNYGLNHTDSDRDLFIVTDGNYRKIQQVNLFGDDAMVMNLKHLQNEIDQGHYQLVDTMNSPMFHVVPRYQPMFNAFRYNDYKYIDSAYKTGTDFIDGAVARKLDHPRRAKKYLQTTFVASFMVGKVKKSGTANYIPTMDETEREQFFEGLEKLWEFVLEGYEVPAILAEMKKFSGVEMLDHPLSKTKSQGIKGKEPLQY